MELCRIATQALQSWWNSRRKRWLSAAQKLRSGRDTVDDGALDEIDLESWQLAPLDLAEPSNDWTGPMDLTADELDLPPEEAMPSERAATFGTVEATVEAWEDPSTEEDIDEYTERLNPDVLWRSVSA